MFRKSGHGGKTISKTVQACPVVSSEVLLTCKKVLFQSGIESSVRFRVQPLPPVFIRVPGRWEGEEMRK